MPLNAVPFQRAGAIVYATFRVQGADSLPGGTEPGLPTGATEVTSASRWQLGHTNECAIVTGASATIVDLNHRMST